MFLRQNQYSRNHSNTAHRQTQHLAQQYILFRNRIHIRYMIYKMSCKNNRPILHPDSCRHIVLCLGSIRHLLYIHHKILRQKGRQRNSYNHNSIHQ